MPPAPGFDLGTPQHRRDIDGLRAVAILGVLAYHFGIGWVTGGYAGVDVFFVISGYLIAGIIKRELADGSFSIARFYVRRIRRIVPALAVMLLVTTAVASFMLFPNAFKDYGRSMLAAATATSNFFFARQTGYFDGAATGKPLLHTWSLSVEEQFYLVFPLLVFGLTRFDRRLVLPVLALLAAGSLAYGNDEVATHPQEAFFQTSGRAWELLTGVLVAYGALPALRSRAANEIEAAIGAAMIVGGYWLYSDATDFPGLAAVPFCLGAALILHAGESPAPTAVARALSLGPLVSLGLISYSVYLWHWPLLVLIRYRFPDLGADTGSHTAFALSLIAASLALGALSWRLIEQPFRLARQKSAPASVFVTCAITAAVLVALSLAIIKRPSLFQAWPAEVVEVTAQKRLDIDPACAPLPPEDGWPGDSCRIGRADKQADAVLWGDSHAATLIPDFVADAREMNRTVIAATYAGCPPLDGVTLYGRSRNARCQELNSAVIDKLSDPSIHRVILAARWALYAEGVRRDDEGGTTVHLTAGPVSENAAIIAASLERTIERLAKPGREIIIIASIPEQVFNVGSAIARHRAWQQPLPEAPSLADFLQRQKHVAPILERLAERPNVRVVYPHRKLCDEKTCRYAVDGAPLYWDTNHLNARGLQEIASLMPEIFGATSPNR